MADPFFGGPGLDRADALRAQPERIAALAQAPDARLLAWDNGAPALDADGPAAGGTRSSGEPALFLGLDGEVAHFSALPPGDVPIDGRARISGCSASSTPATRRPSPPR